MSEQGNAKAQYAIGQMYRFGKTVPQDYEYAFKWYRMAAEQGLPDAQNDLSMMYSDGEVVSQNSGKAVKWMRFASDQGNSVAQLRRGMALEASLGGGKTINEVSRLKELAWSRDDSPEGRLARQCLIEAHMWYHLAASNDNTSVLHDHAIKARDALSAKLSREDIAVAQRLAREWKPKTWEEIKGQLE